MAYSKACKERLLERIAEGELLTEICKEKGMPQRKTIWKWRADDPEFEKMYQMAREMCVEKRVEEIFSIGDDSTYDVMGQNPLTGEPIYDHEHINRSKLKCENRKWYASKVVPKLYGEKVQQEISGKNGAPLVTPVIELVYESEPDTAEAP